MSVYIKGFPLPNNCGACPLRLAWCRERIYMVTRPERCPIVPVPPHGRLIDADALRVDYFAPSSTSNMPNYYHVSKAQIDNAPTIIESEGEDG